MYIVDLYVTDARVYFSDNNHRIGAVTLHGGYEIPAGYPSRIQRLTPHPNMMQWRCSADLFSTTGGSSFPPYAHAFANVFNIPVPLRGLCIHPLANLDPMNAIGLSQD